MWRKWCAGNRFSSSPCFLLTTNFFSWIFHLYAVTSGDLGKMRQKVSIFTWAFPTITLLFCKSCSQGLQYYLGFSQEVYNTQKRQLLHVVQQPAHAFPSEFLQISFQFSWCVVLLMLSKNWKSIRKILIYSSLNYVPSIRICFSKTQTDLTVP
jgi:hypothetical protein